MKLTQKGEPMEPAKVAGNRKKKKKASGSESRQRPEKVTFRVSDAERNEIDAAADRAGLTVGSYVRMRALASPETRAVKTPRVNKVLLSQMLGQLGRVGGNIHQIVKRMNYKEGVESAALVDALSDFKEVAAAIMQTMGRLPP